MDALCAAQGERLVVLLGGVDDPRQAAAPLVDLFGPGPVVVGPVSADLGGAYVSARAATAAHRAATGWPEAPRPVLSVELLPERALAGDGHARRYLVEEVFLPLATGRGAKGALVRTLASHTAYYKRWAQTWEFQALLKARPMAGDLSLGDRWKARARLPAGTHVPHPGVRQSRVAEVTLTFARPTPVRLDGVEVGRATTLSLRVEPDAVTVVV